jgi:DNA-binding GntR family transcriptional regulator
LSQHNASRRMVVFSRLASYANLLYFLLRATMLTRLIPSSLTTSPATSVSMMPSSMMPLRTQRRPSRSDSAITGCLTWPEISDRFHLIFAPAANLCPPMTPPTVTSASPLPVPDKSLLKQRAYDELKERILDGTFQPGAFLSERQLAAQLGMSKTPVKAALERLEAEGCIAGSPQQGIVVRDLSVQEIVDQFQVRLALETFVVRAIAGKLNEDETERVRENLRQQQRAAIDEDLPAAVLLDADFHAMLCEFLGNQEINRVMSQFRDKMHRVITRVFDLNAARLTSSQHEHQAIADAIFAGDADRAAQAVEEHLNYGKQFLLSPRRR